jgi:hypothetical protein
MHVDDTCTLREKRLTHGICKGYNRLRLERFLMLHKGIQDVIGPIYKPM